MEMTSDGSDLGRADTTGSFPIFPDFFLSHIVSQHDVLFFLLAHSSPLGCGYLQFNCRFTGQRSNREGIAARSVGLRNRGRSRRDYRYYPRHSVATAYDIESPRRRAGNRWA